MTIQGEVGGTSNHVKGNQCELCGIYQINEYKISDFKIGDKSISTT